MSRIIDLGSGLTGHTRVHIHDDEVVTEKVFDAEPFLDEAAESRAVTQGMRWGNGKRVGIIPLAVLGQWMRLGIAHDPETAKNWLRKNPAFCTFDKFLK